MSNPVLRWQILTKQPQVLQNFYSQLFGWKISSDNPLGYREAKTNAPGGIDGGFWPLPGNEGHSMVQLFIHVDDVEATLKAAQKLGANIIMPKQVLPGGDIMAIAMDPDGITFGIFTGAAK